MRHKDAIAEIERLTNTVKNLEAEKAALEKQLGDMVPDGPLDEEQELHFQNILEACMMLSLRHADAIHCNQDFNHTIEALEPEMKQWYAIYSLAHANFTEKFFSLDKEPEEVTNEVK